MLERKLKRSEVARKLLEGRLDKSDLLRKHTIADLENARYEVQLANDLLSQRVKERTADLEKANNCLLREIERRKHVERELHMLNTELVQARDQALKASEIKSNFLANMSHELRTPLNAVIGYSEIIEEELQELSLDDILDDLNKLQIAAKHQLVLINDVLDLARIEAEKLYIEEEIFVPSQLIEEVVLTSKPMVEKNNNTLVIDIANDLPVCRADKTKLSQIILNLLSNAAKFTQNGCISVRADIEKEWGGECLVISVEDTGVGFDNSTLAALFEPFTQGDSSSTKEYGGTGLGLAISKQLITLMGGDLDADGVKGVGATFTIKLPYLPIPNVAKK